MNITSIGTGYTPLRSSQSFGMELNPSAEKIINDAKDLCSSNRFAKRLLKEALSIIEKYNPKDTLDINYNKDSSRKVEALKNGKIFFTTSCDNAFQVVRSLACYLDSSGRFSDKCYRFADKCLV